MRVPTGIDIDYKTDRKGYMKAYYAKYRDRLLADTRERGAKWRTENLDYKRERARRICAERKEAAFALFGSKCQRCGYRDSRALQIDHIEQFKGTRVERVKAGEMGEKLYARLLSGPASLDGYQLLCANCNWIKRHENGECRRKP